MIGVYALAWLGLAVLAVVNGAVREATYGKRLSEPAAHRLATLTAIAAFSAFLWVLSGWRPMTSAREAWLIGLMWLAMTVAFEFMFGRWVAGRDWRRLLMDYNLLEGRLWLLLLLWTLTAPRLAFGLRAA